MTSSLMKKALIISYYFPPCGGSGVQRTLKFVKYLPQFGWQPIVLTAQNPDYPAYDPSFLAEIPKVARVYKAQIFEPYAFYRRWTGRDSREVVDIATLTLGEVEKHQWTERLAEWIRAGFFVPDARVGWLPFAVSMGLKIIRRERVEVLYSSAPPYTCHIIGLFLKCLTGLPWVADFRDSWIGWLSAPQWRPHPSRYLESWMEGAVLKHADRVLTVSKGIQQDLLSRHPGVREDQWLWLPNGYDAEDLRDVVPRKEKDRLTFTYTGSLYGNRNPHVLLEAVKGILQEHPELKSQLKFRFVGRIGQSILAELELDIWQGVIETVPYVSHRKCLEYLLGTDVCLLIIDDAPVNRGILTGKLFEYLGARKPILALAPEGEAATLIRELGAGVVASPNNAFAIKQTLIQIIQRWKEGSPIPTAGRIQQFERYELTRKLGQIFDSVLN